jgi:hypothetical protein
MGNTAGWTHIPNAKVNNSSSIKSFFKKALAPPAYLNPSYTSFSEEEGARDYKITERMQEMNFRGNTVNAVLGNKLVTPNAQVKRDEYFRQLVMDWNNQFMRVPLQAERMNNPAHMSFVRQPQLTVPNAYGQWYAFMKALSAAFGTIQS